MEIKIKVYKVPEAKNEIVRLNAEGTAALKRMMRATGTNASYLVSQILCQVEELGCLTITEVDGDDDDV